MAYWDIVYEVIDMIDKAEWRSELSKIYVYTYDLPDDEGEILVFGNGVKKFNDLLKEKMKDIPEVKQAIEDYKYDVDNRDDWYIELAVDGDEHWAYDDQGFLCCECYKWHWYDNGGYGYANYFVGDGYILCEDCIKEDPEPYLESMINCPTKANTIFDSSELIDLGFERVNTTAYANGWYGRSDDPKEIYDKAREEYPDAELLFSIKKTYNPFETEFYLFVRETA